MNAPAPAMRADPLADDTIAAILGPWSETENAPSQWQMIDIVNRQIAQWQSNGMLPGWRAADEVPAVVADTLEAFIQSGMRLPDWADPAKLERAESLFMDMSMMSCALLFCSSLPECYVIPDLAGVLHAAGQLEQHADYRIRSTAAMLFPVMMRGGLTSAQGGGVAQTLKVRLIHATIRHLIMRGNPGDALLEGAPKTIEALADVPRSLQQTLYARGWDLTRSGVPCNQEELAYTLLTFSYAFLRGLRSLGLGLPEEDETAYLHAWNVVGHVLGIERGLMSDSMVEAEALFKEMQVRGRADPIVPDPRPALGKALMQVMENEIPLRVLKPFPVLLTRYLCGPATSKDLGINGRVAWYSVALFAVAMVTIRLVDKTVRLFLPNFSFARLFTRIVGYQFTVRLLMNETRPLKLPVALLNQVDSVVRDWQSDPKAPKWVNKLEAKVTGRAPLKPQEAT